MVFYWICILFYMYLVEENDVISIICEALHFQLIIFFVKNVCFINCFEVHISSKASTGGQIFLFSVKVWIRSPELNEIKLVKLDYTLKKKNAFFSYFYFIFQFTDCRHHHLCRLYLLCTSEPFKNIPAIYQCGNIPNLL